MLLASLTITILPLQLLTLLLCSYQVQKAISFARNAHHGQFRKTGDPYLSHCLHTALTLAVLVPSSGLRVCFPSSPLMYHTTLLLPSLFYIFVSLCVSAVFLPIICFFNSYWVSIVGYSSNNTRGKVGFLLLLLVVPLFPGTEWPFGKESKNKFMRASLFLYPCFLLMKKR